jgi:hypothetical protein
MVPSLSNIRWSHFKLDTFQLNIDWTFWVYGLKYST